MKHDIQDIFNNLPLCQSGYAGLNPLTAKVADRRYDDIAFPIEAEPMLHIPDYIHIKRKRSVVPDCICEQTDRTCQPCVDWVIANDQPALDKDWPQLVGVADSLTQENPDCSCENLDDPKRPTILCSSCKAIFDQTLRDHLS